MWAGGDHLPSSSLSFLLCKRSIWPTSLGCCKAKWDHADKPHLLCRQDKHSTCISCCQQLMKTLHSFYSHSTLATPQGSPQMLTPPRSLPYFNPHLPFPLSEPSRHLSRTPHHHWPHGAFCYLQLNEGLAFMLTWLLAPSGSMSFEYLMAQTHDDYSVHNIFLFKPNWISINLTSSPEEPFSSPWTLRFDTPFLF